MSDSEKTPTGEEIQNDEETRNDKEMQNVEETQNDKEMQNDEGTPTDGETDKFILIRCDHDPPVKDAVFLLSATNSVWMKRRDWVHAPPCCLNINLR